jgi:hypothetical protein
LVPGLGPISCVPDAPPYGIKRESEREREREREREKRKGMERRASTSSQPSAPRVLESGSDFGGGGYAAQKKVHTIIREFFGGGAVCSNETETRLRLHKMCLHKMCMDQDDGDENETRLR